MSVSGNMLGGLLVGDTMLAADPGTDTGGGGAGGGGLGNLLGDYLLGDPILGGDPGSGSGGDIGASGNTWTLSGHIVDRTTVTGDLSRITAFIQGRPVLTRTTVAARLSLAEPLSAAITTRTAVTGNLFNPVVLTAAEAGATTVTGDATRSIMRGQIRASTSIAAALRLVESIRPQTARGLTAVTGRIALAGDYSATANGATVVTGNAIKPFGITGELILGSTTAHGDLSRHILRGRVAAVTALSARLSLRGQATVIVTCATAVRGALSTSYSLYANVADATTVRARLHVYPVDFQDIVIRTRSTVAGAIRLKSVLGVTIDGATDVTGRASIRYLMIPRTITGATTVHGRIPTSFGADLDLRTSVDARLNVWANTWRGQLIKGVTVVTGNSPDTSLRGRIGGYQPWYYASVAGALRLLIRLQPMPVNGATTFHSHFRGHWPHDGPLGSVVMTALPAGDMGVPNEVNGSSTVGADVTVERSRILTLVGNAGLAVERDLVLPATAAGGTGTRNAAVPWDVEEPVLTHRTLYV